MLVKLSTGYTGSTQVSLNDLDYDLKRMLRVQFKEFIHYIEDHEMAGKIAALNNNRRNRNDGSFGSRYSVA